MDAQTWAVIIGILVASVGSIIGTVLKIQQSNSDKFAKLNEKFIVNAERLKSITSGVADIRESCKDIRATVHDFDKRLTAIEGGSGIVKR